MSSNHLAQGIIVYSTIYLSVTLFILTILTGRLVLIALILLTFGLAFYLNYLSSQDSEHLKEVGRWMENTFYRLYELSSSAWKGDNGISKND